MVIEVKDYLLPQTAERWAVSKPLIPTPSPEGCHGGFSVSVRDEECAWVWLFLEKQTSHKRTSLWRRKKKRLIFTHQKARQGGGGVHSVTLKESAGNSQNTPKLQIHEIFWLHVIIGEG